ncbi:MAG: DUF4268 domain-containing protein [Desulfobacteraceae bacterium]|nr:DUF4268 domain-containing protein [Desulfobacteraceae bacterium]
MIGKIERLPLREVWKNEALDFTTWLEENIDILNENLDLNLSTAEREKSAGAFSVDLVAEDDKGNSVVIENQLEKSNHDHLGKLITYLTAIGAKTAIWIVADPRPEHVNAISWLNESSSASFYLIKVEAVRIGDSEPAPLLTLIVGPSEEATVVGKKKKEMAERYIIRKKFWTQLLDYAKTKTKLHASISPNEYSWIGTGTGLRGLGLNYTITKHTSVVELYIDRGKDQDEENKKSFDQLATSKKEIEEAFGESLDWQQLEGKRACRIRRQFTIGGYRDDEEKWPLIHEAMVNAMIRLEKALKPHIKGIKI